MSKKPEIVFLFDVDNTLIDNDRVQAHLSAHLEQTYGKGTRNKKRKTMRIKDARQGLHTLLHTQGLDGLMDLYKRLEKRGRALLLCLLCAEAGWLVLVNAWLRLERAYLKLRLFLRV